MLSSKVMELLSVVGVVVDAHGGTDDSAEEIARLEGAATHCTASSLEVKDLYSARGHLETLAWHSDQVS